MPPNDIVAALAAIFGTFALVVGVFFWKYNGL